MGIRSGSKLRYTYQRFCLHNLFLYFQCKVQFGPTLPQCLAYSGNHRYLHCRYFTFILEDDSMFPSGQTTEWEIYWAFANVELS
jgi:hypothetical protein